MNILEHGFPDRLFLRGVLQRGDGENEIEIVVGQLAVERADVVIDDPVMGRGELNRAVAEAFAFIGVPAFVVAGKVFEHPAVAAADFQDFRAEGKVAFDETVGEVVLVNLQVAGGGIGITDVVGLKRLIPEQFEVRPL